MKKQRTASKGMSVAIVRGVTSFPDQMRAKLKYSESVTLVSVSGALASYFFSGNNLYDPNVTGTGHQPYGFDQYTPFFQRYAVVGARCRISAATSTAVAANVCLATSPEYAAVPTSVEAAVERPRTEYGIANAAFPLTLQTGSTASHMFGVASNLLVSSNDFTAAVGSSPAKQWYFRIFMDSVDLSTTATLYVTIEIEYDAVFFERLQPNGS